MALGRESAHRPNAIYTLLSVLTACLMMEFPPPASDRPQLSSISDAQRPWLESEGAAILRLVARWDWIDRRMESVAFIDDVMAQRKVSITFTTPSTGAAERRTMFLPLGLINKDAITGFDFVDETGRVLPLLPASEKSVIASGVLIALLKDIAALAPQPKENIDVLIDCVRAVAECDHTGGAAGLNRFWDASYGFSCGTILRHDQSWKVHLFQSLMRLLAHNYLVIVPLDCSAKEKRIITFSYRERVRRNYRRSKQIHLPPPMLQSFLRSIGWMAKRFWFPTPAFGQGGSYHFEVTAPDGLKITQATLLPFNAAEERAAPELAVTAPPTSRARAHLFSRDGAPALVAMVYVKIRARGSAVMRAAMTTALGTATILWFGYAKRSVILGDGFDVQAAGSLLLLVPTIASVYVVNAQEHPMTTHTLLGVRVLTLVAGTMSFLAGGVLVLGTDTHGTKVLWLLLTLVATTIAAILVIANLMMWKEDEPLLVHLQRYRRKPEEPIEPSLPLPPA